MIFHYNTQDTIAAIATPPGEGGVAIVRISGKEAMGVAKKIFSRSIESYVSHTAHYGHILDANGKLVDQVLLLLMRTPRSYTGEDTVEIHCHGGSLISRRVLETVLSAGARLAQAGEFTFRAFINGKIDLSQAEAVQELICAKNQLALNAAEEQLQGKLSHKIAAFQHKLLDVAAIIEAWVDFPEEGLEFASQDQIVTILTEVLEQMQLLHNTFYEGKFIQNGISLCLAGKPNVGKSSLMNALLGTERAIVTEIAGTTRDLLEDQLLLNGLNFKLIDTAGIRDTEEMIEKEGVRRSKKAIEQADLILLVLDVTTLVQEEDRVLLSHVPQDKTVVVWNKCDQPHDKLPQLSFPFCIKISAKEREGLDLLSSAIDAILWRHGHPSKEEVIITNLRHKEALAAAIDTLSQVILGLGSGVSPEFLTSDMRACLQQLGRIIGMDITEDILSAIFSKFCIGK